MSTNYAPRRIVSLQPSATLILRDLGKLDLLVACTKYCAQACPEVVERGTSIVADSWTAQSDQIRALQPDFVIASVPYQEKSVIEILKANTPFLALAPKKLADIYSDIAIIARIVDAPEKGDEIICRMQDEIHCVSTRTRDLPKPRVFCEEWGKPLIASQKWVAELVEAAGGEFMGTPGAQLSFEEVVTANPNVIIAAWCGAGDRVPLEKIIRSRQWENVPAVRNGRVYCIQDELLNTPAPTLVQGLHALAAAIHPEHFPQANGLRCINALQPADRS
ncbi:MAG TPA: ABC transporter substrate-binding protein [Terriglobales bacterium]|nr:ABC transporter substrate-binding protein [Terriglobales bacterium]